MDQRSLCNYVKDGYNSRFDVRCSIFELRTTIIEKKTHSMLECVDQSMNHY